MERKIGKTKKRTPAKTPVKRKRRVSGVGNADFMTAAQVMGGAIGGRLLGNMVAKFMPGTSTVVINGGQVVVGYLLPKVIKKPWAKNVGLGCMATGATSGAVNLGLISGVGSGDRLKYSVRKRQINGPGLSNLNAINGPGLSNLDTINGYNIPMSVNGIDDKRVSNPVERAYLKSRGLAA